MEIELKRDAGLVRSSHLEYDCTILLKHIKLFSKKVSASPPQPFEPVTSIPKRITGAAVIIGRYKQNGYGSSWPVASGDAVPQPAVRKLLTSYNERIES
jgi:hypothetical protein